MSARSQITACRVPPDQSRPGTIRPVEFYREPFTHEETLVLSRFFSNVDRPVFTLLNLPEVVKGALFARYSRSAKSLRRLFLDEFLNDADTGIEAIAERIDGDPLYSLRRAERLYDRVFFEFGDDSVAQLGGAHIACEQASNLLTKVLERGRLAAYLEQSTRYIYYDVKFGDRYRFMTPPEIETAGLAGPFTKTMNVLFDTYSHVVRTMTDVYARRFPRQDDPERVWKATIRAKACDTARGLLPAATLSNVGIFASGQAYEALLIRMQAHPLTEVREYGAMMLDELRTVIPSFLKRVDVPDRGGAWSEYLADTKTAVRSIAAGLDTVVEDQPIVTLTDWDPDAETKLVAAALYAESSLPDARLLDLAREMPDEERARVVAALVGDRRNRRHRPGRAMERPVYRFDVLCDYGAFRDLQRHRMLTIDWQKLTTQHGYRTPDDLTDADLETDWDRAMAAASDLYTSVVAATDSTVAQYVVPFGFKIRFVMEMNAREAFHLIELRSQPAGHAGYRNVAQEMHRQIRDVAGHHLIADAMSFVDYSHPDLERLESERRTEQRRTRADS
jgi:thymidylate synthase ThyX